jgi:hypothetical protein
MAFIMDLQRVICEVLTESLYIAEIHFTFKGLISRFYLYWDRIDTRLTARGLVVTKNEQHK